MSTSDSESSNLLPDLADRQLGDFRLLRQLGVGGMAEVYLAEQQSLRRLVAVKILQEDAVSAKNKTLLQRFEQEARAAGGLSDPTIVQVFMIGQEDDLHYIVQEYVQGQNLSQWCKRNGPPDFLTGLKWMKQVATALKVAADAGIVHRDIKPENIMLTPGDDAKVTDFGLAQLNEKTEKLNLTQDGTTMGTPWYMSPEQIQGEKLDFRSDQYSFGVTCYHMFAGQPPFPGRNSVSVAVQHLKDEAKPLNEHRRDLPDELCAVVHQLMAKKPEDRFESPEALLKSVENLDSAELKPELLTSQPFLNSLLASIPSMRFVLTGLALCLVIGLLFGRRIFAPDPLPSTDIRYPEQASAAQQYAMAVLQPRNEAGWKSVFDYFPKSEEALWARLQLGVHFLTKKSPDLSQADFWFDELRAKALENKRERRHLLFLALLGQAYVAEQTPDEDRLYRITSEQLASEFQPEFQSPLNNAPRILQECFERRQQVINNVGD